MKRRTMVSVLALGTLAGASCMVYDKSDLRGDIGGQGGAGGRMGSGGAGGTGVGGGAAGTGLTPAGGAGSTGVSGGGSAGGPIGTSGFGGAGEEGGEGGATPVAGSPSGGTAGNPAAGGGSGGKVVVPPTLIDDFEDRNHRVYNHQSRNGFWYTFAIGDYQKVLPIPGSAFNMYEYESEAEAPPGTNSIAAFRLIVAGVTGSEMGIGAGVGFNFTEPKNDYDGSSYTGLSFWIRANKDLQPIDVRVVTRSTDNEGEVCTKDVNCSNHFRMEMSVGTTWKRESHTWNEFQQDVGWGKIVDWNPKELFSVQFFVRAIDTDDGDVELFIDDVSFVQAE